MATEQLSYPAFTCPRCAERGENAAHLGTGRIIGGIRYCRLCAGEVLDHVVMAVHAAMLSGPVTWHDHSVSLRIYDGGIHEITIACPCWHGGSKKTRTIYPTTFGRYWDMLESFVEEHFNKIQELKLE